MILQMIVFERWIYHAAIEVQKRIITTPPTVIIRLQRAASQNG